MSTQSSGISRRSFLAAAAAVPVMVANLTKQHIPVGLEFYSVYKEMERDLFGTIRAVAKMGYEVVEFIPSHYEWKVSYARELRSVLDDAGIRCVSTRNWARALERDNLWRTLELNKALGSGLVILTPSEEVVGIDGWKRIADTLNEAAYRLAPGSLRVGYHNHDADFELTDGWRPIEVLTSNLHSDVVLEMDIGSCLRAGYDPAQWIRKNPGRFPTLHVRDWSDNPTKGYRVLLGEGIGKWHEVFQAAEEVGGIEYYLIEQEGSDYPPMETAERCLKGFHQLHG